MRLIRNVLIALLAALLMVGQGEVWAQQKKQTTTSSSQKSNAQKKPTTTSKPASKPAAKSNTSKPAAKSTSSKPAAKPAAKSNSKPAAKGNTKPAAKSNNKSTGKSNSKPAAKKDTKPAAPSAPAKRLSRAEYEKQQRDLQKQIAATEKMISENDQSVVAQNRDIQLRKDEIGKRQALMRAMELEIEVIREEEDSLTRVIKRLTHDYQGKQEKFTAAVKHIFKWRSGYDAWMFVISADDFITSLRRARYLGEYSAWRKRQAVELEQQRLATESVRQRLELTRSEREELKGSLEKERQNLAAKQKLQEEAVAKLKKRNKELKGELASAQKKQREIQKMIQQLIEEERKKAEAARKKAGDGGKESGSSKDPALTYYSPAEVAQLTGSFRQNKGKMPYPVDSNYAFLSHYTADGNYSINLSTSVGAHACAVFEGTVSRVVRSSEDYTIIITHGEYMSVYSNLSAAHVKEGEKVKMRQSIGVVKADIDNRRAQLMFWIYGKNDAENPESWLKK